jgi:hypothetical protein
MLWIGLAVVLAGAGAVTVVATTTHRRDDSTTVRTEVAPLRARFPAVGELFDPHWLGYNPRANQGSRLPEPDPQLRVVGVARLPPGTVKAITSRPGFDFRPAELIGPGLHGWPGSPDDLTRPPEPIVDHLPSEARWVGSTRFDISVTGDEYQGRFYFDQASDTVYFDTVNPTA